VEGFGQRQVANLVFRAVTQPVGLLSDQGLLERLRGDVGMLQVQLAGLFVSFGAAFGLG